MLTINTRNNKLAAARVDFTSRGMLHGTCLGEAVEALRRELNADVSDSNDSDESSGPDGNDEHGSDLDLEDNYDGDDGSPGPVDGPPIFSEVVLANKKGTNDAPSPLPTSLILLFSHPISLQFIPDTG